jgi:uncharacterized membrane protein HdeD (DUF308 family)
MFLTYLPCFLITLGNILILVGVIRARQSMSREVKGHSQETKIMFSLALVSVFYIIFMLPASVSFSYMLYIIIFPFEESFIVSLNYTVTFFDEFSMLNYCFNFVIYGCTLPFYREEAYAMITCFRRRLEK